MNEDGSPKVVYHQTAADFTVFNTDNPVAGASDSETPNGIFFKTNDHDIGLGGDKQMAVYLKAEHMLHFANRKEANAWYCKNVPGYAELQDEMTKALNEFKPEFKAIDDEMFAPETSDERYDELDAIEDKLIEKMGRVEDAYRAKLRELLNKYFLTGKNVYDGIELDYDGHRYVNGVREDVHTYIVFNPEQIKSASPVTYDDAGKVIPLSERFNASEKDIRYALRDSSGYEVTLTNEEVEENKKYVANMQPVVTLTGNPMQKDGNGDFYTKGVAYFNEIGNAAENPVLGRVALTEKGIRHIINRRLTWRKTALLRAVKPVIENGRILHVENDHNGKDTAIIAATVAHDGTQYYMGVVVSQNSDMSNTYEVHDAVVVEKQKEGNTALTKTPSAGEDQTRRGGDLPIAIILSDLANYNREFAENSQFARRDEPSMADVRRIVGGMQITDRMNDTEKDMLTRYQSHLTEMEKLVDQINEQKRIIDSDEATDDEKKAAKARMNVYDRQRARHNGYLRRAETSNCPKRSPTSTASRAVTSSMRWSGAMSSPGFDWRIWLYPVSNEKKGMENKPEKHISQVKYNEWLHLLRERNVA